MKLRPAVDLGRWSVALLVTALILSVLHHTDHVLRHDHSGWPFRPEVTPFTFSLLAYPMMVFALLGSARLIWVRVILLMAGTGFVIYAHTAVETPLAQYVMWAENRSLHSDGHGESNLLSLRSPVLGVLAAMVSMALNLTALAATVSVASDAIRRRRVVHPV